MERPIVAVLAIVIMYLTGVLVDPGVADVDALAVRGGPVICDSTGVDQARCPGPEACQGTYSVCLTAQGTEVPTVKAAYWGESCYSEDPKCPNRLLNCYVHADCEPPQPPGS
jgi:hypothetical protein